MATKSFAYDHPHYTVVEQEHMDMAVASAVEAAIFRSRLSVLVHTIDVVVNSAASSSAGSTAVASDLITILFNGSVAGVISFVSSDSIGNAVTYTVNRTLASIGDRLGLMHDANNCAYSVIYTYQVLPGADVTVA